MSDTELKLSDVLAIERTRMAADRTLMGWVRTALSLIGFGFTIFKFLQSIQSNPATSETMKPHAPRTVGLTLIGIGVFALVIACIQHWGYAKKLSHGQAHNPWDLTFVIAALIGVLGIFMIVSIILKAGPLG